MESPAAGVSNRGELRPLARTRNLLDLGAQLGAGIIPAAVGCTVRHFTTFDLYGRFDVTPKLSLHGTVTNLFNTKAPADWVTYGGGVYPFNPSLHTAGAVGAYFSLGATYILF